MSADSSSITFTDRASAAFDSVRVLIVPTDLDGTDCVEAARAAARQAAEGRTITVVLYDRSAETWMDHPHPTGPHRPGELSDDHAGLADQLRDLEADGINALGWISTVPSLTEIMTAVQKADADAVLLPEQSCDRSLIDRLTGTGDTNTEVADALEHQLERSVKVFSIADGTVDLLSETTDA